MKLPKTKGKITLNKKLDKYSWFGVGGEGEVVFEPEDINDLQYFLQNIDKDIPITIIGGGSNLLIRDGGIDGIIIILKNKYFLNDNFFIISSEPLSIFTAINIIK